jgi:hypothetical protein
MEKITMKAFRAAIDGKSLSLVGSGFPKDREAALQTVESALEVAGESLPIMNTGTVHLTSAGFYRVRRDTGEKKYWTPEKGGDTAVYKRGDFFTVCTDSSLVIYRLEKGE